jgi:hypothetical protein
MRLTRLSLVAAFLTLAILDTAWSQTVRILVQNSPLAGFQYYAGPGAWQDLKVGDGLALIREPDNSHDPKATRVEWRGQKLGYLPRAENAAVARELDRGARLEARISHLREERNPWKRIGIDIFFLP